MKTKETMNKRQAIIIYNLIGMYIELYGADNFEENYGSEEQFLQDEIGLTTEELNDYTKHNK